MKIQDFILLFVICIVWGLNLVLTRWVVSEGGLQPLFFAAIRFLGIFLLLHTFLRPLPANLPMLFVISMGIGAVHFALLFLGLANADASSVAVVGQLGVPFATVMSMVFLNESVSWKRGTGIFLAFAGAIIISVDPNNFTLELGLLYVVVATFIASATGILMKRMDPIHPLQMQAWVGLFSFAPLFALSYVFESGQANIIHISDWRLWAAIVFAIVAVSIFGHGAFYTLIKKYEISLLSPLTLMTPVWGMVFGIVLLQESVSINLIIGAAISLGGVLVITLRPNKQLPEASITKKVTGTSL